MKTQSELATIHEHIHSQRLANRDESGGIKNSALDRRLQDEERRIVIEALGMPAETPGERYAASTGEMLSWLCWYRQGLRVTNQQGEIAK